MKAHVDTWSTNEDRRCARCHRSFQKGDKYTLTTPPGKNRSVRKHVRCPKSKK